MTAIDRTVRKSRQPQLTGVEAVRRVTGSRRPVVALSLADPAAKRDVQDLLSAAKATPDTARDFLVAGGFLTPTGRLPKKYGG